MNLEPKSALTQMLTDLGFTAVTIEEHPDEDGLTMNIVTEDSARLIGRQGQTLRDLQYLLNRMLFRRDQPATPRITLDVGGYRQQAREELIRKTKDAADKVRRWGDVVELEPMNSFDRRIVHNTIKDDPEVETFSVEVEGTTKKAVLLRPKRS
jgi:spoIIIJ-associated protein